jgi:hypothetical protein
MNGKVIVALVLGVCLGFAAAFFLRQPPASAADPAQKWEYKVVQFLDTTSNGNLSGNVDEVNKEGYEFVTLSATGGKDFGCIAVFKRPKK